MRAPCVVRSTPWWNTTQPSSPVKLPRQPSQTQHPATVGSCLTQRELNPFDMFSLEMPHHTNTEDHCLMFIHFKLSYSYSYPADSSHQHAGSSVVNKAEHSDSYSAVCSCDNSSHYSFRFKSKFCKSIKMPSTTALYDHRNWTAYLKAFRSSFKYLDPELTDPNRFPKGRNFKIIFTIRIST